MNNITLSIDDLYFILEIILIKYAYYNKKYSSYYPQHITNIKEIQLIVFVDICSQIERIKCKIYSSSDTITDVCILEFNDIYKLESVLNIKITEEIINQILIELL